jgi:hypothetical protein
VIPGLGGPNAIATSTSLLPLGPSCVASSDLNGDGYADLVVGLSDQALGTNDKVEVLLSGGVMLGVAVFTPPGTTYTIGDDPSDIAIGDVTGDGRPDILVAEALLQQKVVDAQSLGTTVPGARALTRTLLRLIGGR